jgi:NAD(P)-dependent dehydrogenase (short-subunit alcohol dehydrogenase family)
MKTPDASKFAGKDLLAGRRCAVTGAGLGIGRQIAYTLAEQGARVAIIDYSAELAEQATALIREAFGEDAAFAVVADVSSLEALKAAFADLGERFGGGLDLFVNNAGINIPCRIEDLVLEGEAENAMRLLMVNEVGAYLCAASAYPLLLEGDDPLFVMLGSCASQGSEGQGVYATTKASLRGLLGTLVKEWAGTEERPAVRVGLIEPDYFEETGLRSDRYISALARSRRTTPDKVGNTEVARTKVPLRREGRLVEIAEKTVMMALDTYANGSIEVLSGGKTVRL